MITDKAVPNVVGVDIGCGMYTVNLGKVDIDFEKLDEAAHFIPSGMLLLCIAAPYKEISPFSTGQSTECFQPFSAYFSFQ